MGRPGRGMIGPSGPGPNFGPNNPRMDLAAGEGRLDCPPGGPMRMDNFRSDNPRMDHGLASDFAALNLQIPNTTKVSLLFDFLKLYFMLKYAYAYFMLIRKGN